MMPPVFKYSLTIQGEIYFQLFVESAKMSTQPNNFQEAAVI